MLLLQQLGDGLRERLGLLVGRLHVQRHVDLEPLGARRLGEALEAEPVEQRADPDGDAAAVDDVRRGAGVEVEDHHRRAIDVLRQRERGVQLEIGEVRGPGQRGQVVGEAVIDVA